MHSRISYCVNLLVSEAKRQTKTTLLSSKGDSRPSSAVETILLMCLNYLTICTHIQRTGVGHGEGETSILSGPLPQTSHPCLSLLLLFPLFLLFFLSPCLPESNLWKGRKYTLCWSRALELPDLISLVDVVDWGKNNCVWRLDLFSLRVF